MKINSIFIDRDTKFPVLNNLIILRRCLAGYNHALRGMKDTSANDMECPQCQRTLVKIYEKEYACLVCGYTRWFKKGWHEKRGYGVSWLALLDGRAFFKPMQSPITDTTISGFDRAIHYHHRKKDHSFLLKWHQNEGRVLIGNFFEPIEIFKETEYSSYLGLRSTFKVYYDVGKLNEILSGSMYHRISRVYKADQQSTQTEPLPEFPKFDVEVTTKRQLSEPGPLKTIAELLPGSEIKETKNINVAAIVANYLLYKEFFNKLEKELVVS